MKAQVLYDKTGKVIAILHSTSAFEQNPAARQPQAFIKAREGQHLAILRIPEELEELTPKELHASVHVETTGGSPRLVPARAKKSTRR